MRFDNGQISGRQCRRALLLELFGTSVFLMTGLLVLSSGEACFQMLLLGGGLVMLLGWFYWCLGKEKADPYGVQLHQVFPRAGKWVSLLYLIRFSFRGGFLLSVFYTVLQEFLLKDTRFSYIVIPLLFLGGYSAAMGREKRLRCLELLFWFVLVPFALALLLVVRDMEPEHLMQRSIQQTASGFPDGFLIPLCLYSNVEFILFLAPNIRQKDRGASNIVFPVLVALGCNFLLLLLSLGVLGYEACEQLKWPALRVLQSAKVPGGFLERLDILLVAFWLFAVFSVISGCIFYGGELWKYNENRPSKAAQHWNFVPAMILCYLFGLWFWKSQQGIFWFLWLTLLVDIPLGIILALCIFKKFPKKAIVTTLFCVMPLLFSGCGNMTDVEKWDYVLTMGVDSTNQEGQYIYSFGISDGTETRVEWVNGPTLEQAIEGYGRTHENALQLGHLNAVILGESIYSENKALKDVKEQLQQQSQIPVAVRAYGVKAEAWRAMEESPKEGETLGEYLDELIANNLPQLEQQVTLKQLYNTGERSFVVFQVEEKKITGSFLFKINSER